MPVFDGIHLDFDLGAHIAVPAWHSDVEYSIIDLSTGKEEISGTIQAPESGYAHISTGRKYYVPWRVKLKSGGKEYVHDLNLEGQNVYIDLRSAMGDSIAWMRSVELFAEKHKCKTTVIQKQAYIQLFRSTHPDMEFIPREEWDKMELPDGVYARYICCTDCMRPDCHDYQPKDYRKISVQACGDAVLGVDSKGEASRVAVPPNVKKIPNLVCIACRASAPCKEWHYPGGWDEVVSALRDNGYRVVCIDGDNGNLPKDAEDWTGYFPLKERAELLKSARLFIGLPSGLSWLAYAVGTPHVLIDGMSDPAIEAPTKYTVVPPYGKCRNCWSFADQNQFKRYQQCFNYWGGYDYKHKEPIKKFGPNKFEQYECTKSIDPQWVIGQVFKALKDTEEK